jgi:hypothetical protein
MTAITIEVPDDLARRLAPISTWLPTVLELGLVGFRTPAIQTASEIIALLATGPSVESVLGFHVSDRAQERLRRLLALEAGGQLSVDEHAELDELQRIEHIMIMLKGRLQERLGEGHVG